MNDLAFSIDSDTRRWESLHAEAHAWRGEVLDIFARAERSVGEALHLAGCSGQKYHLVGPKFDGLADLVSDGGAYEAIGRQVRGELAAFRAYDPLRTTLSHGALQIVVSESGDWIATFKLLVFSSTGTQEEIAILDRATALHLRDVLKAREAHMSGQIRAMQKHIPAKRASISANCGRHTRLLELPE